MESEKVEPIPKGKKKPRKVTPIKREESEVVAPIASAPAQTPEPFSIYRFIRNSILGIIGLGAVAAGSVGFAVFFVVRGIYRVIAAIVGGIWRTISTILSIIISQLLSLALVFFGVSGAIWIFWELNPEFKAKVDAKLAQLEGLSNAYLGIPLPNIPGLEDVLGLAAEKAGLKMPSKGTLLEALGTGKMPEELAPLMNITQDGASLEYYKKLIESGHMGENGEGAIPMLKNSLMGGSEELRGAAYQSLKKINTPESRKVLKDFEKSLKDLNREFK